MVPFHPLADIFPMIEGREFDELVADIKANGLREPVQILDSQILDGRNRYRAGVEAGVIDPDEPPHNGISMQQWCEAFLPEYSGDPLTWVLSKNLHRRHLSDSQRALVASRLAGLRTGRPADYRKSSNLSNLSDVKQDDAAERLGVSRTSVQSARKVLEHGVPELIQSVERDEVKVSAAAALAELPEAEQLEVLRTVAPRLIAQAAKERLGNAGRATMPGRIEPDDSLDYFPTPPWATRGLILDVLKPFGVSIDGCSIREPACGEGHISSVLEEFAGAGEVTASDIFDYSVDGRSPPSWIGTVDFLSPAVVLQPVDWTITNPPFDDRALAFTLKALATSTKGCAMFFRSQWAVEGIGRYNQLFGPHPPSIEAYWTERVPLHKGRWEPDGDTMTAYCWLVWIPGMPPQPTFRIPPGRRVERTLPTDAERFTARPVRALA